MTYAPPAWVIGSGGLVGSAIAAAIGREAGTLWTGPIIPWSTPESRHQLLDGLRRFIGGLDGATRVIWSAGVGVTTSGPDDLARETEVFGEFVDGMSRLARPGLSLTLVSSAGGAWAGHPGGEVDETCAVSPTTPYGQAKLESERIASTLVESGVAVTIARPTNVYGPAQDASKGQGLVSALVRAAVAGAPARVLAPLGTARDYVFAADAGRVIAGMSAVAADRFDGHPVTKIVARGHTSTIADVIAAVEAATGRPLELELSEGAASAAGPVVEFTSTVWTDLDPERPTTLDEGIAELLD